MYKITNFFNSMSDKIKHWLYVSNAKKSRGGFIFMCICGAFFIGALVFIATR